MLTGCGAPTSFEDAIRKGNVKAVKRYLDNGASVHKLDFGDSPLHLAVEEGQLRVARLLIEKGASVDSLTYGETPLHAASSAGHIEMVEFLISKGAPVNAMGEDKENSYCHSTPLHEAARQGHLDVMKLLLSKGANINIKGYGDVTPLAMAAVGGNLDAMRYLMDKKADINASDGIALKWAIGAPDDEPAMLLLSKEAKIVAPSKGAWPGVHVAVRSGKEKLARLLIAKGAGTDVFVCAGLGDTAKLSQLIAKGEDANRRDEGAYTPLHWAAEGGKVSAVKLLIKKGADVNATNSYGFTPLHLALRGRVNSKPLTYDIRRTLRPASPWTTYAGNPEVARILIAHGADVNAKVKNGYTPLDYAISAGYRDIVDMLVKRGARKWRDSKTGG